MNVQNVADYFLAKANTESSEESDISNLKLQKLVYYAQAFHLAIFESSFFNEDFEAWTHGPVCPSLYHKYKGYGSSPIPFDSNIDLSIFTNEQLELLDEVNETFGQYSAWRLRNMTHEESPWLEKEETAGIIEKSTMMEFYKTRLRA